ncbi:MAG: hypothetical protein MHPSP_002998, partial [Paramarteilia canceri]
YRTGSRTPKRSKYSPSQRSRDRTESSGSQVSKASQLSEYSLSDLSDSNSEEKVSSIEKEIYELSANKNGNNSRFHNRVSIKSVESDLNLLNSIDSAKVFSSRYLANVFDSTIFLDSIMGK